ncbi:MAG: hypothetical protein IJ058_06280 [Lachnospiraceae bacterium]|nr:hypothetical protein [Lachnospiraceae bacterium]
MNLQKKDKLILAAIPLVFYIAFWLIDGAVWCADSISYVTMYDSREPLYPTLLALFRRVIGYRESLPVEEQPYLFWVAGFQSLLAAFATGSIAFFLTEHFKLNRIGSCLVMMIPIGVSLLNRFAARRGSMYSNCILTEGITISIYLLFFRYELEYIFEGSRKGFIIAALLAFAGITARKQMYVLAGLLIVGELLGWIRDGKRELKRWIIPGVALILIFTASGGFDRIYNYALRGAFIRHTEDNRFVTTVAMYTADRNFAEYIDPEIRDVFLEIYDECDASGYLGNSAPTGWMASVDHFGKNYDHIQLDVMEAVLERTVDDLDYEPLEGSRLHSERMDIVRAAFNKALIPHEIGRLFRLVVFNFLSGLVLTAAKMNGVLVVYSVAVYAFYLMMLGILTRKCSDLRTDSSALKTAGSAGGVIIEETEHTAACIADSERKYEPDRMIACRDAVLTGVFVLFGIVMNVGLVSAVIFCQTRYTIYNMPLLYCAMIIMGRGITIITPADRKSAGKG